MKELVKEAFDSAERELKENQISEVKKIVLKTLEKIEVKTKERDKLSEEVRLLKMDIDDLKEGKIERIVERQEKDPKAKETSVVIIIKEKEIREISPWYWPYRITWQYPVYDTVTPGLTISDYTSTGGTGGTTIRFTSSESFCITNSAAKDGVAGSYTVENKVVHLR